MIPPDWFQALRDAPGDDALRLVLADKLEENGESDRAGLIRLQVSACRESLSWHEVGLLMEMNVELTAAQLTLYQHIHRHAGGWLPGLEGWLARHVSWDRGLAGTVKWPLGSWLKHGAALDALEPLWRPSVSDRTPENVHGSFRWCLVDDGRTWTRYGSLLPAEIFYRLPGDSWMRFWSAHATARGGVRRFWGSNDYGQVCAALGHAVGRYCREGGTPCEAWPTGSAFAVSAASG